MKEYKPIIVFYLPMGKMNDADKEIASRHIKEGNNKAGYDNILVMDCLEGESKVEIISVDKATVVEDIQKYIDEKLLKDESN